MRSRENFNFNIAHPHYYEPIERYVPDASHFRREMEASLPQGWSLARNTAWFVCSPPQNNAPLQGWKIHVSSVLESARDVLRIVAEELVPRHVSFKFAVDRSILAAMNSKNWSRGGAAKFITIYPHNDTQFAELLNSLYTSLKGFNGPYVLSDRRFRDSPVIYYRYGSLRARYIFNVEGERQAVMMAPDGSPYFDQRSPWYQPPPWVVDPFAVDPAANTDGESNTLKEGRYQVLSVMAYSNAGGVYLADDRSTGTRVIIKEARPFIQSGKINQDAQALLSKEYRLLEAVRDDAIAPAPVDLFQDWEHRYLVEEFISGMPLSDQNARRNVNLFTAPTPERFDDYYEEFKIILIRIGLILERLHARDIVFSDLSPRNLIWPDDSKELKIIDFEGAFQIGVDPPVRLFTPGFVAPDQLIGADASFASDLYAFGAIALAWLFPTNNLHQLRPQARFDFLKALCTDVGVSPQLGSTLHALIGDDSNSRPSIPDVVRCLEHDVHVPDPTPARLDEALLARCADLVAGANKYMMTVADPARDDRLFPADWRVFATSPMSVAFGAAGVARALKLMTGTVPDVVREWMIGQELDPRRYPPGLYCGLAGIAWALWDCDCQEKAIEAMDSALAHQLRLNCFDMFYGMSGLGLAAIRMFLVSHEQRFLNAAEDLGHRLIASRQEYDGTSYWSYKSQVPFGYAHGAAGAALFLLELQRVTGDSRMQAAAEAALRFDLQNGRPNLDGGLSWPYYQGSAGPLLPYFRYGSAGIGTVVVRMAAATGADFYRTILDRLILDTNRKYSVGTGLFMGLAGLGEFLLDVFDYTADPACFEMAKRVASGLELFAIPRPEGVAFPGERLTRISCDYGTGAAGVALFLHRLVSGHRSTLTIDGDVFNSDRETFAASGPYREEN
jgi:hypothetical protein